MKQLSLLIIVAIVAACSSIQTSYDYDKNVDFTKFKTYGYTQEAANFGENQLLRDRILGAIDSELAARGLTKSDNPDVLIDLRARVEQKQEATATTTGMGGYYGGPWRYGYGTGFTTTQINVNDYLEGTLFVNVVDKAADKLVWQGRGMKTLDESASPEKRDANVTKAIKAIFAKYPVKPAAAKK